MSQEAVVKQVSAPEIPFNSFHKNLLIIVPIAIPGMGKTFYLKYLAKQLHQWKIPLTVISSDKIR